ncbi:Por secretion system C-terminal sorting domain-containing protein [Flavobacterium akiainvivens]|nr:Por secretion system C-terminal sorting domain-containing protein [Flavobacterium akiainvivens]
MALFCATVFYGQHRVANHVNSLTEANTPFKHYTPLAVSNSINKGNSAKAVENATYAKLNPATTREVTRLQPEAILLDIPYGNEVIHLQLYRVNLLADGFHIQNNKGEPLPYTPGAHYRGIIAGDETSLVSFNFFNKEVSGIISGSEYGNLVVGRLQTEGNFSDYIIYRDATLNLNTTFTCGVTDMTAVQPQHNFGKTMQTQSENCVTVYFEIDYDLYLANSGSVQLTNNWLSAVFNNTQTLFDNDGITVAIKSVYVWTEQDPYVGEDSSDYLFQFYQLRPYFDGDVGQLLGLDPIGKGGVALGTQGLCTDTNVSYGNIFLEYEDVPVYSNTVEVVTHELGHLFGSPHTHGCYWNGNNTAIDGCGTSVGYVEGDCEIGPIPYDTGGTIMSYCHLVEGALTNFANGFGPQPAQRILDYVESSTCLSSDCINTCINAVVAFDVSQTTQNSITVSWTDAGTSTVWEVGYASVNNNVINWNEVTTNSFTFYELQPNTYYKFAVRPLCETQTAPAREVIVATSADWCSGAAFTDTSVNGNYPNNQYLLRTIKPENPNDTYTVSFEMFDTEEDYDFMYVYDGADTNAPLLGAFDGTTLPGPFTSTAADGSLTFEFISDNFVTGAGWNATVSCLLDTKNSTFNSLKYYPNPAQGIVTITTPDGITGITVYNIAGQLLLDKTTDSTTETTADISAFSNGVYFFKVTNGTKQSTFRIVKE